MNDACRDLLIKHNLAHLTSSIADFVEPCIAFDFIDVTGSKTRTSKLGGDPFLPESLEWPNHKGRPLELVLQLEMAEVALVDTTKKLPSDGLLTFFYDMDEQPWGFDPRDSAGFKVHYTPAGVAVSQHLAPDSEFKLQDRYIRFRSALSVPTYGSRPYDKLEERARFSDSEADRFVDFSVDLALLNSSYHRNYWGGKHRLLGYSDNVQGDMQLEAELVTKGLYCGDPSGYNDSRATALESNADDWILLLQIDSDEGIDLMWGDVGSIYFWIRRGDLAGQCFDDAWMALQCS